MLCLAAMPQDASFVARVEAAAEAGFETLSIWEATPLHLAAKSGHTEVVRCLLLSGAQPDALDQVSNTTPWLVML